ncbi:MAG: acyltransferase family protein [Flammeovirgaceae bacterium]
MKTQRMYDLDWLRVIAIVLVLYFHVAMIFTADWEFHIKNNELSNLWLEFNYWLSRFRMPLLFFISGVGSHFALKKRSGWVFLKERHHRLVIPLIFSMLVIVPPQIFIERIFEGEAYASFFEFYPTTLEFIPYPEGNFSWHHMWFVCYLFCYSLIALPIFLALRSEKGKHFIAHRLLWLAKSTNSYLLFLPTVILYLSWTIHFNRTNNLIADWGWFPYWFMFFLVGYIVATRSAFWESIKRNRKISLKFAVLCIVILNYLRWNSADYAFIWTAERWSFGLSYLYYGCEPLAAWFWLFAIVGYGRAYLNKPSKFLSYANEGIYPFYILHQTVLIVIGYYVIQVEESIAAKYIFISTLSLFLTVALYEFGIRPYGVMRFLFGMKSPFKPLSKMPNKTLNNSIKHVENKPVKAEM